MKDRALEQQILDFLSEDPNFCLSMGLNKNLSELPDPGKNGRIKKQGKLRMYQNRLKNLLKEGDHTDTYLWWLYLEQYRLELEVEIDAVPKIMKMPRATKQIIDPILMLMINDPREPRHRLVNMIGRLSKVPEYIQSYCRNIKFPVKRWVQMELASLDGTKLFFASLIQWAENNNAPRIELLKEVINKAQASLQFYRNFLTDCEMTDAIHVGEDNMQEILISRGIVQSPEELHEMARTFIAKNRGEIEILRIKLVKKYNLEENSTSEELQKFLARKFSVENSSEDFSDVLNVYRNEQKDILAWNEKTNLFPLPKQHELEILKTPHFLAPTIPAGAMISPAPLREGVRKSLVYLTLEKELLDEHTKLSIINMMVHEGIPGHHLQLSMSCEHPSLIRRIFSANDLAEGWTTMLEDFVLDAGYKNEFIDELKFVAKRDIARIGARVAIDLYFMSGDKKYLELDLGLDFRSSDPFENAGKLLAKVTGFVPERVQGELNWYSQESGYPLSYLLGNVLMYDLKGHFEKSKSTSSRDFHQFILSSGNLPLSLLNKELLST